jgi:hypothetical protein
MHCGALKKLKGRRNRAEEIEEIEGKEEQS